MFCWLFHLRLCDWTVRELPFFRIVDICTQNSWFGGLLSLFLLYGHWRYSVLLNVLVVQNIATCLSCSWFARRALILWLGKNYSRPAKHVVWGPLVFLRTASKLSWSRWAAKCTLTFSPLLSAFYWFSLLLLLMCYFIAIHVFWRMLHQLLICFEWEVIPSVVSALAFGFSYEPHAWRWSYGLTLL